MVYKKVYVQICLSCFGKRITPSNFANAGYLAKMQSWNWKI